MPDRRTLALARAQRRKPAATEALLWRLLRDRKLADLKFRRQVPLGSYIADFVCLRVRLIVEADGPHHDPEQDAIRDTWLTQQGFRVLRFTNAQVQNQSEAVLDAILRAANRL